MVEEIKGEEKSEPTILDDNLDPEAFYALMEGRSDRSRSAQSVELQAQIKVEPSSSENFAGAGSFEAENEESALIDVPTESDYDSDLEDAKRYADIETKRPQRVQARRQSQHSRSESR